MDLDIIRGIMTALLLILFIGIWLWAWSGRRKQDFSEAAMLPLAENHAQPINQPEESYHE